MRNRLTRSALVPLLVLIAIAVLGAILTGCGDKPSPLAPVGVDIKSGTGADDLTLSNPRVLAVLEVQNRNTEALMRIPSVIGTATGVGPDGKLAILVLTEKSVGKTLPAEIGGIPVVEEVTGVIKALDSGPAHRVKQTPPIQLGTSGGWRYDLANGYCCGGTLGSMVQKAGVKYVLSNYHVLEADIVNGGNARVAVAGDPVVQPGLIDVACNAATAQNVASLSGIKSLPGSNVDAAIASVITGMVNTNGSILDVGTIGATTVAASINQNVKKSGRTTGLTRSRVTALNATVSVQYENECAGGVAFTKTFTGQIIIRNQGSRFLAGGDSGSLMVQDVTTNPKAIGLLFAGSSSTAVANPIGQVLSFLGATMVGQ